MRIRKVKHVTAENADKISIVFEKKSPTNQNAWDEFSLICNQRAAPQFYAALKDLAQDVIDLCELPQGYLDRVSVKGVSVSISGEKDTMGAVITASMQLLKSNQPLNINTPHKTEEFYAETGDEAQLLNKDTVRRLYALFNEAERYVDGEREQTMLPLEAPKGS
jgi:hypothetical protein